MENTEDGLEMFILSSVFSQFSKKQIKSTQSVDSLVLLVCIKLLLLRYLQNVVFFLPQAWRERYGGQGATGRTRAGYTELKDNQSSPVTETKRSGRGLKRTTPVME